MELSEVIEGCMRGNKVCQTELYLSYHKLAHRTVKKYVKDDMDVEDIVQNGFVKLYHCIGRYDMKGNFDGWIYRIFKNMSIDFLRKNKTYFINCEDIDIVIEEEYDHSEEKIKDIKLAIEKIPDYYKTVVNMFYYDDLTHKEIGRRLQINEGTSKAYLHRAKQKLIKILKNKIYEK